MAAVKKSYEQCLLEWRRSLPPPPPLPFEETIESDMKSDEVDDDMMEDVIDEIHETYNPLRHIHPCLMVGKQADDELILKKLDSAKPISWLSERKYDVDKAVIHQVASMLSSPYSYFFKHYGYTIVTGVIQVFVTLIFMLYRKETLFRMAHRRSWPHQMDHLWEALSHLAEQAASPVKALELITQLVMDKHTYSFLTEEDAADIFHFYCTEVQSARPFSYSPYIILDDIAPESTSDITPESTSDIHAETPVIDKNKEMYGVIHTVIKEMTPLEDDHYVRVLTPFLRETCCLDVVDSLIGEAMKVLPNIELNEELKLDLYFFLARRIYDFKIDLNSQLISVLMPLGGHHESSGPIFSNKIIEIMQFAELRRMALGRRFISRSHLIWAYYEHGYGLPDLLRNRIKSISFTDEDHPPYHIYVAARKLADSAGMEIIKLECFICAVFFSDAVGGFDEEKMNTMLVDFRTFFPQDSAVLPNN